MSGLDREHVLRWSRDVEYLESAVGVDMSPTAGHSPRKLSSLAAVGHFLQSIDDVSPQERRATVHYVNPAGLAAWVRDVLGDTDLGARLAAISEDGRAYGLKVHDMKHAIASRLEQYAEALQPEEAATA